MPQDLAQKGCDAFAQGGAGNRRRQRCGDARAGSQTFGRCQLRRDRPQSADARLCRLAAKRGQPHPVAPGRRAGVAVRRCQFRSGVLPVRRDVLPGSPIRIPGSRRVLKPGGCFLFNVWDRIEENVFADDVTNALATFFPSDPPRFLARTPHGYHDTALIRTRSGEGGLYQRDDRDPGSGEPRALAASCRHRLLPGNAIAQRDRGERRGQAHGRHRPRGRRDRKAARKRRDRRQDLGPRHHRPDPRIRNRSPPLR